MLVSSYIPMDPDAVAFLNAQGNSDARQKYALNRLVVDLKQYGLWSKMAAIYPFLGSTATMQKWNLKDPRNLDAAYRLVFFGGWTHTSNGALPNGANAYADTFLQPSVIFSPGSLHFAKYIRTNDISGNKCEGCYNSGTATLFQQNISAGNGLCGEFGSIVSYTPTDTRCMMTLSRTATNNLKLYRNNLQVATDSVAITNIPATSFYIGARNDQISPAFYNAYETAFESIGTGLTLTDTQNLYTAVQRFQTTLGRQV